jgi:CHAT domain-containing protein
MTEMASRATRPLLQVILVAATLLLGSSLVERNVRAQDAPSPTASELEVEYLRWATPSLEARVEAARASKDLGSVLPQLQALRSIYLRTGDSDNEARARKELSLAYQQLGRQLGGGDLREPQALLRALDGLYPATPDSESTGEPEAEIERTDAATRVASRILEQIQVGNPSDPLPPLHAALLASLGEDFDLPHVRARALAVVSILALDRSDLELSLTAYIDSGILTRKLSSISFSGGIEELGAYLVELGRTQVYHRQAGSLIAEAVFKTLAQDTQQYVDQDDYTSYLREASFAADIFVLADDLQKLWSTYYMLAIGYKEIEDPGSQLVALLDLTRSFLETDDEECEKLLADELTSGVLTTGLPMAHELILASVAARQEQEEEEAEGAPEVEALLSREQELQYSRLVTDGLRRLGNLIHKEGVHFESLLLLTHLEMSRNDRQAEAVLGLYEELVAVYRVLSERFASEPDVLERVRERLLPLNLVVFSDAFDPALEHSARLAVARRSYDLVSSVAAELGSDASGALAYAVVWADLLWRNGYDEEAREVYEQLLELPDAPPALAGLLLQPFARASSVESFVESRLGMLQRRAGEWDAAAGHQERALAASRRHGDQLAEIRALLALAVLDHARHEWRDAYRYARLALDREMGARIQEEQQYATMPVSVEEFAAGQLASMADMLSGPMGVLMSEAVSLSAIRWEDEEAAFMASMTGPMNPEPPSIDAFFELPPAGSLQPTERALAYVELMTTVGRCFDALGDPIKAEHAYRNAESVAREHALDQELAALLFLHARLYTEDHRYFDWFEEPPHETLRWNLGPSEPKNVFAARSRLRDAFRLVRKEGYSRLRMEVIASAIEAYSSEPAEPDMVATFVARGMAEFDTYKAAFRSDPRLASDPAERMALAKLYTALEDTASDISQRGDAARDGYEYVRALRLWDEAASIYRVLDAQSAVGGVLMKSASVWRYLNDADKELETLQKAADLLWRGSVSYLPVTYDRLVQVPVLIISKPGHFGISGIDVQRYRYYVEASEIQEVAATGNFTLELALVRRLTLSGKQELARNAENQLLKRFSGDTGKDLVTRQQLAGIQLEAGRAELAVERLEETLARTRRKLDEQLKGLSAGELEIDLSTSSISYQHGQEMALDEIDFGDFMTEGFEAKNLLIALVHGLYLLGAAHDAAGNADAAVAALTECSELGREYGAKSLAAQAEYDLAAILGRTSREEFLRHMELAYNLTSDWRAGAPTLGSRETPVEIRAALGKYHFDSGNWGEARRYDWEAAQIYEGFRANLGVPDLQAPLMDRLSDAYERLVVSTLRESVPSRSLEDREAAARQAFEYAESAKSRSLLDSLGSTVRGRRAVASDSEAGAALRATIAKTQRELADLPEPKRMSDRAKALEVRLHRAQTDFERLQIQRSIADAAAEFEEAARPASVQELQRELSRMKGRDGADAVLVGFFVAERSTVVWLLTEDGLDWDTIEISRAELEQQVEDFLDRLTFVESPPTSDPLYGLLLGKFAGRLSGKRVVVVPHGILHRLPFGALRYEGHHLVETSSVSYLPSASMLPFLNERRDRPERSALILYDPDGSLEYTHLEASRIEGIVSPARVLALGGADASRVQFMAHHRDYSLIHFATHGTFNPRYPIFSSLRLADGELLMSDVTNMGALQSEIVVLSACSSGASKIRSGDELLGLSGAFLRAGAAAVLVNLWKADDDTTPILIEKFYENLVAKGRSKDAALRAAMQSMIDDGHPRVSWGGFALIGKAT